MQIAAFALPLRAQDIEKLFAVLVTFFNEPDWNRNPEVFFDTDDGMVTFWIEDLEADHDAVS